MTRLFLRFYLGVVAILIIAWLIQSYVFRTRSEADNVRVVEQALSGGARLAVDELAAADPDRSADAFEEVQDRFDYPVGVFRFGDDWVRDRARQRLGNDEVVLLGQYLAIAAPLDAESDDALDDDRWGLIFGPLPRFVEPSQAEITFGYGIVFLLAAIAIAILLRPVVSQFRSVERTAAAIAKGDLSARVEAIQDLALVRAFNSMADRTETTLRSQRELLQAVSHELRTPLARIRFATDLVEAAQTDEERHSRLQAIDNATQKLDDLVGELLTYTRLDSAEGPASESETIHVHNLLEELVAIHAPLHPDITYIIEDSQKTLSVHSNRASLSRAVENLLSNAGHHAHKQVIIRAVPVNDGIEIQVDDDGEGVPEENREKIFEPFVRLENSKQRGTGLGLALVQRIAKRVGANVAVSDSPIGGARFSLKLVDS